MITPTLPPVAQLALPTDALARVRWSTRSSWFLVIGVSMVIVGLASMALPGVPTVGLLMATTYLLRRKDRERERRSVHKSRFAGDRPNQDETTRLLDAASPWSMAWMP